MGKMFFNILATFAEFEPDLIRMRTREGMAIARAKGKLRVKQPKLTEKQQKELGRMHATGNYSVSDPVELFAVSRPTIYRTISRIQSKKLSAYVLAPFGTRAQLRHHVSPMITFYTYLQRTRVSSAMRPPALPIIRCINLRARRLGACCM
jgi:hypothetical protein